MTTKRQRANMRRFKANKQKGKFKYRKTTTKKDLKHGIRDIATTGVYLGGALAFRPVV